MKSILLIAAIVLFSTSLASQINLRGDDLIFAHGFELQPLENKVLAAYFTEWGVYGRNYHVKDLHTSNQASKITHIIYAFGNVVNSECTIGDDYAAIDKYYDAASSVDGTADSWDEGALRGNFNQLLKLKTMYPHIKVLWSFGGWTWSAGFGDAYLNKEAFANSCYELIHDQRWDGLFDGIDLDWEYPNECGFTCDNSGYEAYGSLLQAVRARFGNEIVTSAIGAGDTKLAAANYGDAAQYLNFYMLMTYDFFGAWSPNGPTAPHSPLMNHNDQPQNNAYSDYGVQYLISEGVPANKILLGIGLYGRGWQGVVQSTPGGSATAAAPGTYELGINDYKVLKNSCPVSGYIAGTAYAHCGDQWWSFDDPISATEKTNYLNQVGLGGAFVWEVSGDTTDGELINAIYQNIE